MEPFTRTAWRIPRARLFTPAQGSIDRRVDGVPEAGYICTYGASVPRECCVDGEIVPGGQEAAM
jgi:hypothetical protein